MYLPILKNTDSLMLDITDVQHSLLARQQDHDILSYTSSYILSSQDVDR